jgi:para-nitrobenzyl esterase
MALIPVEEALPMHSNRRTFFKTLGTGAAGLTLGNAATAFSSAQTPARGGTTQTDGPVLHVGEDIAVADTSSGKVRGYILRDIYYFLGIPYGADTSGANRFMPPQKPKPWTNVFPALWWGNTAPQNMDRRYAFTLASFRDHWNYDDVSEDCLRLNVFTPALNDGRKRPVMFWIHGGGFSAGNGIEQDGYNGENLARFGDVVFVSINHRLGPLGYCNLAGVGGERFAASGNVGMLDIVAALEWVRDNIATFGGDPGNVTIMGQSGGGAKVCILTAMPSAKGLFHKAVVESGAFVRAGEKEHAEKLGAYVLKEAGLAPTDIGKLQALPWTEYYDIATKAQRTLAAEMASDGGVIAGLRFGFSPSVDGHVLPQHPYVPEAAPTAADIPMIICSTKNEMSPAWPDASQANLTVPEVVDRLKVRAGFGPGLGDRAQAAVDAYAKAFPGASPAEIFSLVSSNRQSVVTLADAKVKQPSPVFVSWFAWQPPLFDGRMGAFHCIDISFWLCNTDLMLTHSGGGARPRRLSKKMAGSLVQFMKTGDPNGKGLTVWPKYTPERGETLVLDDVCEVKNDPDREAREALGTD